MKAFLIVATVFLSLPAAAKSADPRRLGPFRLGMTAKQFAAAAKNDGFTKPRLHVPQERDIMGIGLMTVQPVTTESTEARPDGVHIWQATGYLLSGRLVYLNIDFAQESPSRLAHWYQTYRTPPQVQKALVNRAWADQGVVLYCDRFGVALHALDFGGLRRSGRISLTEPGARTNANAFFRRLFVRQGEASLDLIRQRVIAYFGETRGPDGALACKPPVSAELTPGPDACELPDKRFPRAHEAWLKEPWRTLRINPAQLSRYYSYGIEASGQGGSTRIVLTAVGDLNCDGTVATIRVRLSADARANGGSCRLGDGQWELVNPHE